MTDLYSDRQRAAELTHGISGSPIYQASLKCLLDNQSHGSVLEFGAGQGYLIQQLLAAGSYSSITGVDILSRPAELPVDVQWIVQDLNLKLNFKDEQFDVLVSTEVIEHLENPRAVVREWYRVLKPGGFLIFSTPNQESIRSYCTLLFGGHFAGFLDASYPAHITHLLRKDILRIFKETGFNPPSFIYSRDGRIPKLASLSWQQLSFGFLQGRLWSDNVIVFSRKPSPFSKV